MSTDHATPAFVADTANVLTRELQPLMREPFGIVISLMQPLVFLALFAPLLPDMGPGSRRCSGSCPASSRCPA